jgi:HD-GYP domain-containing protein (c-di-GMP phosphodiesterase class II)
LDVTLLVVAASWCAMALLALVLVRAFLVAASRHDALSRRAMRSARPGRVEAPEPRPAPRSHAADLVETGYLGLMQDRLCSYVRVLLGIERSWLLLRDGDEVIVVAARGGDPEEIGQRLPAERGLMELMLASPRPTVLREPDAVKIGEGAPLGVGARLLASAPVSWEGSVRGALAVATRSPHRSLQVEDLELLGEVAWLSGAALALNERRAEMAGTVASQVEALATALAVWDGQTREHSDEVVELARLTGARMGLDRAELLELELAALLHDVGKLRVPRETLRKQGPLTGREWRLMRNHPAWGAELVSGVPGLQAVALIVRHHHERVDGAGYPTGLAGVRIPAAARIVAVCDAYGAMTGERPYRTALSPEVALAALRREAGTQFDPAVVDALEAEIEPAELLAAGRA